MIASLLVCAGLLAQSPPTVAPELAAYKDAAAHAGRDPDVHVKLALWCEAHGLDAERLKHLARAILVDPKNATARGLMGLVAHGGRWESPEAVSQKVKGDEALAAKLAQYEARRDQVQKEVAHALDRQALAAKLAQYRNEPEYREKHRRVEEGLQHKKAAQAHVRLALWCEKNDLRPEAIAHFTEASQLYPTLITPWEHMGYKKHQGRWMTEDQIASQKRDVEAQRHADRYWEPLLRKWKVWLGEKSRRGEAEAHLSKVTDPRAIPSIWRAFVKGDASDQRQAIRLLERTDSPDATRAMVMLAVFGAADDLRENALEKARRRDPRDVISPLMELIHSPLRYTLKPPTDEQLGNGSKGTLEVEGEQFNAQRTYYGPLRIYEFGVPIGRVPSDLRDQIARERLIEDVNEIMQINAVTEQVDELARPVLKTITGQDFGPDPDLWRKWWAEQQGYVYDHPNSSEKRTSYQTFGQPFHPACFGAGTQVRTRSGPRGIESLRLGDCVLSQDTSTGALSYQPVVAVHKNPPNQTLRIRVAGEAIVTTGIHRFWKAGHGWVMARALKAGDVVRIVGGTTRIERVEPDEVQPVYNLEVASNRNFFVGHSGLLVHDFGVVEFVPEPFDAPPNLVGR